MARPGRTILATGGLAALAVMAALAAQADEVNSAAYPKAPGGMPAAADKGKPVMPASDPAAKPGPAAKASTEGAPTKVGVPSTAYPDAPGGEPAAADHGEPVKP